MTPTRGDVVTLMTSSRSVIHFDDGIASISEVAIDGAALAAGLRRAGVSRGDRIAVWMDNGRRYVEILSACAYGGFVAVSVNTRYGEREAVELINRSGARWVAVDDARAGVLPGGIEVIDGARHGELTALGRIEDTAPVDDRRDAPFIVFTTSGTTSRPKMVLHHQRSIADHAVDVAANLPVAPDDVALIAMPLCGVFGLTAFTSALAGNATIVMPDRFDVVGTGGLIRDHRVSMVHGSDDMFHRLLESGADLSSIRMGGYGRFNTSLDGIVERCDAVGARLMGLYGMSEVQALFSGRNPTDDIATRWHGGGRLLSPEADYRVEDGELLLRGPSLFAGYLREGGDAVDTELTNGAHSDGWFRTGDLAEAEDERTFTYVARMGDALRLGGFLVAPAEIEQALVEIEGIDDAQVVAVDRPTGARPVAFVVAPDGIDEQHAIDHCAARLARYKVPVRVSVIEAFPVTQSANGTKIQKNKLRDLAADLLP